MMSGISVILSFISFVAMVDSGLLYGLVLAGCINITECIAERAF